MLPSGRALLLSASLGGLLSGAPFQCASESDPNKAVEETPGQALYELAEQFKENGDDAAWRDTLKYLIEHYPSSRFAASARDDLSDAGVTDEPPDPQPVGSRTASSPK
jgi:hypothetical protein